MIDSLVYALKETLKITTFYIIIPTSALINIKAFVGNKIELNRINKYSNHVIKNFHLKRDSSLEDLKKRIKKDKVRELLPYLRKLEKFTSQDNLYAVYNNLRSVKVKRNKFILLQVAEGMYDSSKNLIELAGNRVLGHEFLHLASSNGLQKNGVDVSGFEQYLVNEKIVIGRGLNEGYTELLTSRIYQKGELDRYFSLVKIAKLLEFFFEDKKEMEKYYFNSDLPGFVKYMEQFMSKDEIINLIKDIDTIYNLVPPMKTYYSAKVQLNLYKIFRKSCRDKKKIKEFERLVYKNKIVEMIIKQDNLKSDLKRKPA